MRPFTRAPRRGPRRRPSARAASGAPSAARSAARKRSRGQASHAEAREVGRRELAVEELEAPARRAARRARRGPPSRRRARVEHRLAEERRAEGEAVDAADEAPFAPGLRRVGEAQLVQLACRRRPSAGVIQVPSWPGRGAAAQASITLRNARVEAQLEAPAAERAPQAPRDAQRRGAQHGPRVRRVPEDGRAAVPREDAEGVGEQQPLGPRGRPRRPGARPARPREGRGRPARRSAGRRARRILPGRRTPTYSMTSRLTDRSKEPRA